MSVSIYPSLEGLEEEVGGADMEGNSKEKTGTNLPMIQSKAGELKP